MCSPEMIAKADLKRTGPDSKQLGESQNRVEARSKPLAAEVARWLRRYARYSMEAALGELEQSAVLEAATGDGVSKLSRHVVRKASRAGMQDELRQILTRHGMRMVQDASWGAARQSVPPQALLEFIASKEIRLQQIEESTRISVQASLRQMFGEAMQEDPRPSTGEIARRIRTSFMGQQGAGGRPLGVDDKPQLAPTAAEIGREIGVPGRTLSTRRVSTDEGGRLIAFGPDRAALIARTEMVQAENSGILGGMAAVGVRQVKWLAYRDGRSGGRHHERMNKHPAVTVGEMFTLPSGVEMPYPGWPQAPISEIANCRCTIRAVRVE